MTKLTSALTVLGQNNSLRSLGMTPGPDKPAEAMDGWNGSVARLLVNLLAASGLRRKELRLARMQDLTFSGGTFQSFTQR